jgi:L-ascorbate 6-phosphate lactonase
MSQTLANAIRELVVEPGSLAIFWIAQAGFVYKTPNHQVIYIDPYLSDCVHRLLSHEAYGFKRIMRTPIEAEEVEADLVVSTHAHPDHFDLDAIPVMAQKPRLHFAAAPDCREEFEKLGVPASRYTILEEGKTIAFDGFSLTGVYADHGPDTPLALGVLLQVGEIKVWQVGDTAYRPEMWQSIFDLGIDVIIPPINGTFDNLDGIHAAMLARDAGAKVAIPCHFWMFVEQGGSPAQFIEACKEYAPGVKPLVMAQTELFIYRK